ncbi:MAG: hypothetical protein ABI347_01135 [Nitrososphaera sp.]
MMRPNIHTYPQPDFEVNFFASLAIASAAGAIISLVMGFTVKDMPKAKASEVVPKYAGIEYPFEVIRLAYEGVIWPVYAQDPHPIMGEPLFAPGPKCPLCDRHLVDSSNHSSPNNHLWKCAPCRFAVTRKESIEDASEHVRKVAYQRLREQKEKHRGYFGELQYFLTGDHDSSNSNNSSSIA